MSDLEELTYNIANFALILTLTDLGLGIVLERTGLVPGAERFAVALAGVLFVFLGLAGLALVIVSWWTNSKGPRTANAE